MEARRWLSSIIIWKRLPFFPLRISEILPIRVFRYFIFCYDISAFIFWFAEILIHFRITILFNVSDQISGTTCSWE